MSDWPTLATIVTAPASALLGVFGGIWLQARNERSARRESLEEAARQRAAADEASAEVAAVARTAATNRENRIAIERCIEVGHAMIDAALTNDPTWTKLTFEETRWERRLAARQLPSPVREALALRNTAFMGLIVAVRDLHTHHPAPDEAVQKLRHEALSKAFAALWDTDIPVYEAMEVLGWPWVE
jgi:hypothetical protein